MLGVDGTATGPAVGGGKACACSIGLAEAGSSPSSAAYAALAPPRQARQDCMSNFHFAGSPKGSYGGPLARPCRHSMGLIPGGSGMGKR